jgi:hypothetical protein
MSPTIIFDYIIIKIDYMIKKIEDLGERTRENLMGIY